MPEGASIETHGLAAHLQDAIRLNRARWASYVRLGGVRAGFVSSLLIAAEAALLPFAHALDRAARPYVEAGVPILVADLMPMPASGLPEVAREVNASPQPACLRLGHLRLGAVCHALRGGAFPEAADALAAALGVVRDAEAEEGRAYALTAHVLESAGLMALRALVYAEASGGETGALSRRIVAGHLPLMRAALGLDRLAHPVQAHGIPLLVSDLPAIPFEAEHAP